MNRRGTGVVFCAIAAFLFSARYVVAAIFGSNVTSWDSGLFNAMLEYVGTPLAVASFISLIVGIAYLAWAEVKENDINLINSIFEEKKD